MDIDKQNEITIKIAREVGIPDALETTLLRLVNDAWENDKISRQQYYSTANDLDDARLLIVVARRLLCNILKTISKEETKNAEQRTRK